MADHDGSLPERAQSQCNAITELPWTAAYLMIRTEDVPAFVELESGGPPPVACQVVGVGQLPSHPTKEGDRREQHLPEEQPPCPA